jgi:hypothetical protein
MIINGKTMNQKRLVLSYHCIRYVDNFVVLLNHKDYLNQVIYNIENFLKDRGLKINKGKSRVIFFNEATDHKPIRFSFLGYTFMYTPKVKFSRLIGKYNLIGSARLIIHPDRERILIFKKKIKDIVSRSYNLTATELIVKLNPIIS